jgi:hypothetical protein
VSNVGHWTWTVPGTPGVNCMVRVSDASNPGKHDESSIFTIAKQWISTTSPCAGDAWFVGRPYFLTWNWGGGFDNAKLEYTTDGGSTWALIIASVSNQGYWAWAVPNTPSATSLVQVTNTDNSEVYGRSGIFEIAPQVITVTSPLAGDTWKANRAYYITWNWTGEFDYAKVEYTTDGGSNWNVIIASATNVGYWAWQVPNTPSSNCMVKVTNVANIAAYGTSGVFVIGPPDGVAEQAADPRTEKLTAEPNPSCGRTMLRYALPVESNVNLVILDASGRLVACPVSGRQKAGVYNLAFDAARVGRRRLSSGVYFCRLATGGHVQQCRFVIAD